MLEIVLSNQFKKTSNQLKKEVSNLSYLLKLWTPSPLKNHSQKNIVTIL